MPNNKRLKYIGPNETKCPFCGGKLVEDHCEDCGAKVVDLIRCTGYISFKERMTTGKVNEIQDRVSHSGGESPYKVIYKGKI